MNTILLEVQELQFTLYVPSDNFALGCSFSLFTPETVLLCV